MSSSNARFEFELTGQRYLKVLIAGDDNKHKINSNKIIIKYSLRYL
jgi:hypothetical protein